MRSNRKTLQPSPEGYGSAGLAWLMPKVGFPVSSALPMTRERIVNPPLSLAIMQGAAKVTLAKAYAKDRSPLERKRQSDSAWGPHAPTQKDLSVACRKRLHHSH